MLDIFYITYTFIAAAIVRENKLEKEMSQDRAGDVSKNAIERFGSHPKGCNFDVRKYAGEKQVLIDYITFRAPLQQADALLLQATPVLAALATSIQEEFNQKLSGLSSDQLEPSMYNVIYANTGSNSGNTSNSSNRSSNSSDSVNINSSNDNTNNSTNNSNSSSGNNFDNVDFGVLIRALCGLVNKIPNGNNKSESKVDDESQRSVNSEVQSVCSNSIVFGYVGSVFHLGFCVVLIRTENQIHSMFLSFLFFFLCRVVNWFLRNFAWSC